MLANSGHVMTLANSIIGVGILAMPFCFQKCGIVLAIILLIVSNWVTRICCHYLIKSSLLTRRKSFEFLGFHAFGSSGKLLVELCIIGYLLGTCITYFVVVGDLGPQIVMKMLSIDSVHRHLRIIIMIAVTLICILPLGMLKKVDSLSAVCTASIGFYICLVLKVILESQDHIVSGDWTEKVVYWEPAGVLQCLPIFSMALSCQMQLFEVFSSVHNQSQEKLNGIVRNATWICTLVYIAVGFFGYVAFCTQSFSGNILLNFSPSFGSDVIKIGFILSVAFSFPLVIFPCRASIYSLLYRKGHVDASGYIPEARFRLITIFIVGVSLCIALMIPSVELIIGLVGSTIGVAICIMFPAACFRKIIRKESTERLLSHIIFFSGFGLMILGTYANLNAIDEKTSGPHLEINDNNPNAHIPIVATSTMSAKLISPMTIDFFEHLPKKDDELIIKTLEKMPIKEKETNNKNVNNEDLNMPLGKMEEPVRAVPPLPVDDDHDELPQPDHKKKSVENELRAETKELLQAISPIAPELKKLNPLAVKPQIINSAVDNQTEKKPASIIANAENDTLSGLKSTPAAEPKVLPSQQTIAQDAIKKDDDIAAEELKAKPVDNQSKTNDDELKKTQKELKETKILLERTVDELKVELAKQNKETQNLVVEKLGEVVEKVQQIERKVQHEEKDHKEEMQPLEKKEENIIAPVANIVSLPASEAIGRQYLGKDIIPDSNNLLDVNGKRPPGPGEVYEPLSYKTGELIEHARNHTRPLDTRLPLPLALLLNASSNNGKRNSNFQVRKKDDPQDTNINNQPNIQPKDIISKKLFESENLREGGKLLPKDERIVSIPELGKSILKEEQKELPRKEPPEKEIEPPIPKAHVPDKENVEAIRRDILQVNEKHADDVTTVPPPAQSSHRRKRSTDRNNQIDDKLISFMPARLLFEEKAQSYLIEPKLDVLLSHGQSHALDLKMHGFGRDLKSLREEESK